MFAIAAFDLEHKVFMVHIAALSVNLGNEVHLLKKVQIAHLKADKAFIKVFSKYTKFIDIFLLKLVVKLPKYIKINNHAIELVDDWQLSYSLIYSLGLVELEKLKIYIKNNLSNGFIKLFKSLAGTS